MAHRPSYRGVRCVHVPGIKSKQLSTLVHGWVAAMRSRPAGHDVMLVVNVANAAACVVARALGQRIVLNTDGLEWERSKWSRVGRAVFLGSAHLSRWAANALVSDSVAMRQIYQDKFGVDSTVIPYCWTEIEPTGPEALAQWDLKPRGYLVAAGRLVPENNADALAAAYVRSDLPFPLVVLGTANYRSPVAARLRYLASADRRIVLAGHIDNRSVFASLLANARAYLHGHSVGGINPVLIEAMGCGARVVALDTVFNREALGGAGDYFEDPTAVVEPLVALMAEPSDADEEKRTSARVRVASRFSLKAVADAYEGLLAETAGQMPWTSTRLPTRWDRTCD